VCSPSRKECSAFGPSASDDAFDVGFSVPHQRTLVSQHETRATRLLIAMCGRVHNLRQVRSAMCGGSIRNSMISAQLSVCYCYICVHGKDFACLKHLDLFLLSNYQNGIFSDPLYLHLKAQYFYLYSSCTHESFHL
jgi:hypothetical protein